MSSPSSMHPEHLLLKADAAGVSQAAHLIKSGGIVAFPTETVYGLGGNALNAAAVLAIFEAKGRPLTDPLIVHVASTEQALGLVNITSEEKQIFNILSQFWPGPLTIIARAADVIPSLVTANTGFVGVRFPSHPLACRLIEESQLPIAAPSANRFGHVSPTLASHVLDDLACKNVSVLSGDTEEYSGHTCQHGIESSVVKIDGGNKQILVLRQGAVTPKAITLALESCGDIDIQRSWGVKIIKKTVDMHRQGGASTGEVSTVGEVDNAGQEAPGQAITHYAPDLPCMIVRSIRKQSDNIDDNSNDRDSDRDSIESVELPLSELSSTIIVDYAGKLSQYKPSCLAYTDLSSSGSSKEAASRLFDVLRWTEGFPAQGRRVLLPLVMDVLVAGPAGGSGSGIEPFDFNSLTAEDIILGLADRLFRAASGRIVSITLVG